MADDPDQPQKTNREDLQSDHNESVNPLLVPAGFEPKSDNDNGAES